jgi:hypothetical protein
LAPPGPWAKCRRSAGICILADSLSRPYARNLYAAWDTTVVYRLEDSVDSGIADATAHKLEQLFAGQKDGCELADSIPRRYRRFRPPRPAESEIGTRTAELTHSLIELSYHTIWAAKMKEIGLQPSSIGEPVARKPASI